MTVMYGRTIEINQPICLVPNFNSHWIVCHAQLQQNGFIILVPCESFDTSREVLFCWTFLEVRRSLI